MDGPGEAVACGCCKDLVLLHVVEVFARKTLLFFAERGIWLCLGVRFERAEIMLRARRQGDMLDPSPLQSIENVANDSAVHLAILCLGFLARPGGDEHVARPRIRQGVTDGTGVDEIAAQCRHAGDRTLRPGQARHRPAAFRQEIFG